jgi:hypothetical protein
LYSSTIFADDYSLNDIVKIQNDKEAVTSVMSPEEVDRIKTKFSKNENNLKLVYVFYNNLNSFLNNQAMHCEPKYISDLINEFKATGVEDSEEAIIDLFKMFRVENAIDDVMFDILKNLTVDHYAFKLINLSVRPIRTIFLDYNKLAVGYDIDALFSIFKKYPNEVSSCSYNEFFRIRDYVGTPSDSIRKKNKLVKDLAYLAYRRDIITHETFNKIKFLINESTIQKRRLWLGNYLRITFAAKNRMIPFKREYKIKNVSSENTYSSERIARFNKITRRQLLYSKYDENQIILLAQIMKKASQRMGVDPDTKTSTPYLVEEFNVMNANGETQNYVEKLELDTQDQFNLARKMLRKDMTSLQMMDSFIKTNITYDDVVMASLETGYLSLDDIEYVVKYDDLWNPETTKFERYMRLTFRVAGYATFFVPPPYNVTAALTLSIIEGIVDSKNINGADNDNSNTIIN